MKKVLVIWNEVPENLTLYLIECEGDELQSLLDCHGMYIGAAMTNDSEEWISNYLQGKKVLHDDRNNDGQVISDVKVDFIVVTGILL